jgi:sulfide:quinone oxidoreductase
MYMTADYLRRKGILKDVTLEFVSGGSMLFGIKKYAVSLQKMVDKYGINLQFKYDLISIDGDKKEATFRLIDGLGNVYYYKKIRHDPCNTSPKCTGFYSSKLIS